MEEFVNDLAWVFRKHQISVEGNLDICQIQNGEVTMRGKLYLEWNGYNEESFSVQVTHRYDLKGGDNR